MENWMAKIPDNKKIILMNIPGSHDSTAYCMHCLGSKFAKTQSLDIPSQLRIGVRIFDIRVTLDSNSCCENTEEKIENCNDMICCHGICNCFYIENNKKIKLTYKEVLNQIRDFLIEYPTETVIMKTESGRGKVYENLKRSTDIFSKIIGKDLSVAYKDNLTLGEVRGKIVYTIFLTNKITNDGIPIYNTRIERSTTIMGIHRKLTNNNMNFNEYKVGGQLKVREIKDFINTYHFTFEEAEEESKNSNGIDFPLNYETSCTGEFQRCIRIPLPEYEASIVNKFLVNHDFQKGYYYGWISIDFINETITKKIIDSNFTD